LKPEHLKEKLNSVLIVTVTPFTKSDEIDVEGLRENIRFLVEKGAGKPVVLVPTGTTGEFFSLSEEELKLVIRTVVDEANGKLPVVAGTGSESTRKTLAMCKYAEDVGADGVMVILPYYAVPSEEGMYQHYKTIAEGINIGVLIYNNPSPTKCYINPQLMTRISEIRGIIGVKETTKDVMTYYSQQKLVGDKLKIICGQGEFFFACEALVSCPGFVSGYANFAPELSLNLLEVTKRQNFKKIQEILMWMHPLFDLERRVNGHKTTTILPIPYTGLYRFVGVLKQAMDLVGLHGGPPRLPLLPISKSEKEELRGVLKKMGLPVKWK